MRKQGVLAVVAALTLLAGAGAAEAAKLTPPKVTDAQVKRALTKALASGAKPQMMRKARPAWYTAKQERRVKEDPDGASTAPVDAPLPGEVGIRPGSWIISPYWCTANFIFQKSGTLAIGTAGHCVESGETTTLLTIAPSSGIPVLVELGRVLLKRDAGVGKDYALVEIPPQHHDWVFPTLGVVGGPCGVYGENTPQSVFHYGHGLGVGTGGTPRAGMGVSLENGTLPIKIRGLDANWDADSIFWVGMANGGDSGSGVRIGQLPAVSNLTHAIQLAGLPTPSAVAWGTRVTTVTSSGWTLVNSPLCV